MEFALDVSDRRCRADFCYTIQPTGRLFIEDDDSARAVSNLIKYWQWCERHPGEARVALVHIVESRNPAQLVHCRFLAERMKKDLEPRFRYFLVEIHNWSVPDEQWLPHLRAVLKEVADKWGANQPVEPTG
jgi:hypothetical protein